jgi:4-aminobutyrate aminotransferase-like enzyme
MSERDIYQPIIDYLTIQGCFVWRNSTGARGRYRFGKKGAPDIIGVTSKGRAIGVECKSKGKELSEDQKTFIEELRKRGAIVIIAYSLDDVIIKFEEVKNAL